MPEEDVAAARVPAASLEDGVAAAADPYRLRPEGVLEPPAGWPRRSA